jgi:hypothetical protein
MLHFTSEKEVLEELGLPPREGADAVVSHPGQIAAWRQVFRLMEQMPTDASLEARQAICNSVKLPREVTGMAPAVTGTEGRKRQRKAPSNDYPTTSGQVKGGEAKTKFKQTVNKEVAASKMCHQCTSEEPIQCQVKIFMDGHSAAHNAARRKAAGADRESGQMRDPEDGYYKEMEIFVWGLTEKAVVNYLYLAGPADLHSRKFRFFYGKDGLRALYAAMFHQKAEEEDFSLL